MFMPIYHNYIYFNDANDSEMNNVNAPSKLCEICLVEERRVKQVKAWKISK